MEADNIEEALSKAENDLWDAALAGGQALTAYTDQLASLLAAVEGQMQSSQVDEETIGRWADMSWNILQASEHLLSLQLESDRLAAEIQKDVREKFNHVTASTSTAHLTAPSTPHGSNGKDDHKFHLRTRKGYTYIEDACRWLVDNLHNPYPSKETRQSLAQSTQTPLPLIDAWFIETRKRIGWTDMRKKYFNNKRADMLHAASIYFFPEKHRESLKTDLELDFVTVQQAARDLYGGRFSDAGISLSTDSQASSSSRTVERRKRKHPKRQSHPTIPVHDIYPSPPPSSDELDRLCSSQESTCTLRSTKRPRDTSDNEDDDDCHNHNISKRPRLLTPPSEFEEPTEGGSGFSVQNLCPGTASPLVSDDMDSSTESLYLDTWFQRHSLSPELLNDCKLEVTIHNYGLPGKVSSLVEPSNDCITPSRTRNTATDPAPITPITLQGAPTDLSGFGYSGLFHEPEVAADSGQPDRGEVIQTQWTRPESTSIGFDMGLSLDPLDYPALSLPNDTFRQLSAPDLSTWFMGDTDSLLSSIPSGSSTTLLSTHSNPVFPEAGIGLGDLSQLFPSSDSSQEGLRRRLEALRAEISWIEQGLVACQ